MDDLEKAANPDLKLKEVPRHAVTNENCLEMTDLTSGMLFFAHVCQSQDSIFEAWAHYLN